jgi:hypothetical protein
VTNTEKWKITNNYNQQTPKNNLKQKLNPKNKPHTKNPIGKPTTTTQKEHPLHSLDCNSQKKQK